MAMGLLPHLLDVLSHLSDVHTDQLSNLECSIVGSALFKQTVITNFLKQMPCASNLCHAFLFISDFKGRFNYCTNFCYSKSFYVADRIVDSWLDSTMKCTKIS